VCIKHTPGFASRRQRLAALLASLRLHHGPNLPIIVSTEGGASSPASSSDSDAGFYKRLLHENVVTRFVSLPLSSGLSAGRNALVHAVRTPYLAMMDDDLRLGTNRSLPLLLSSLINEPETSLAGGCQWDVARRTPDCFNLRFDAFEDGSVIRARRTRVAARGCTRVHATHNFFVARTAVLRRFGWDSRQRVMEHETFFYQLYLNGVRVNACPEAMAEHDTRAAPSPAVHEASGGKAIDDYERTSLRASAPGRDPGRPYFQYLCKNFPEVRRFRTPFVTWRCDTHEFCTPLWDAQFPFDGQHCASFPWNASDDDSMVERPILAPYNNGGGEDLSLRGDGAFRQGPRGRGSSPVPLLIMVLTQAEHTERRAWQRSTWLSFRWHALTYRDRQGSDVVRTEGDRLVPWRYAFALASHSPPSRATPIHNGSLVGDKIFLTLGKPNPGASARESSGTEPLGLAAVRWALAHVDFECLLITYDSSMVHVGRLWEWLLTRKLAANSHLVAWSGAGGSASAGKKASASLTVQVQVQRLLAEGSNSWLAGRLACKQLLLSGRKLDQVHVVKPPGFRRVSGAARSSALRDKLVIDSWRMQPHDYDGFRALLQARNHIATWDAIPGLPGPASSANL
jgi:hypothetical protein